MHFVDLRVSKLLRKGIFDNDADDDNKEENWYELTYSVG